MLSTITIEMNRKELINAIKAMKKKERDYFLEDLLAVTSPKSLASRKARAGSSLPA